MIYFYDILFSIKVKVDGVFTEQFSIMPTAICRNKLNQISWLFKETNEGGIIIVEKLGVDENSAVVTHTVNSLIDFTFLLQLNDVALLENIKPYKRTTDLPSYSGRSRQLYFNNLDAFHAVEDTRIELSESNAVGDTDFASIILNKFSYTETDLSIPLHQIRLNEIRPNGDVMEPFDPLPLSGSTAQIELKNGAYQLERGNNPANSEILFAQSSLLRSSALGIIQIFKDENIDYNNQIDYEITFVT